MDELASNKKHTAKTRLWCTVTFAIIFVVFVYITRYATVDDFIFYNLRWAMDVTRIGHIDVNSDPFPGFTVLCVIFSKVCGLTYESVVALPFLAPLLIFILAAIIRKVSNSSSTAIPLFFIVGAWMLYFGTRPTLFCHTIGLALCFVVLFVSFLRMDHYTIKNKFLLQSSVLLLILISAINTVSYRLMFFTISFLVVLESIMWFENFHIKNTSDTNHSKFTLIILIGSILTLAFNWFFYEAFIPALRISSEHPLEGIAQLFSMFTSEKTTPLSMYRFVGETSRIPIYSAWFILILISLTVCCITILRKVIKHTSLSTGEKILGAFVLAGIVIFVVYTSIGLADMSYILMGGILCYSILWAYTQFNHGLYKKVVAVLIVMLFLITVYMNVVAVVDNSYGGQTDNNEFQYLKNPAGWYNKYRSTDADPNTHLYSTSTDQLTRGYFTKEASLLGKPGSYIPAPFSKDALLFLLEPELHPPVMSARGDVKRIDQYIINYRESSFVIEGWTRIKSWSNYKEAIYSNPYLNRIYTSGDIDVYNG